MSTNEKSNKLQLYVPIQPAPLEKSHTLYYKSKTVPAKKPKDERKDKIIQTRVNEALDDRLKQEAKRRRLPVSQLIRNLLEDSFELVGNVVDNVDAIAQDAIGLGKQAGADAQRLARRASHAVGREKADGDEELDDTGDDENELPAPPPSPALGHVLAWQSVVMNAEQACSRCQTQIAKGDAGFLGITGTPGAMEWLCPRCRESL